MRDPNKVTDKQIANVRNNVQSYIDSINDVKESPGKKAARKKEKYRANVLASVDKWAANVADQDLGDWQAITTKKGGERIASGMEEARPKILAFQQQFQPFIAGVKKELDEMPDATPEQREQKMLANVRKMRAFKRTRRR
jgi:hypothetical protein